jgi:hypothetical protein
VEGNGSRDETPATDGTLAAMGSGGHDNRPALNEKSNAGVRPDCQSSGLQENSEKNCERFKSDITGR